MKIKMWAITRKGKLSTTKMWGNKTQFTPDIFSTKEMAQREIDSWIDKEDYSVCRCEIILIKNN